MTLEAAQELCRELNERAEPGVTYEVAGEPQTTLLDERPSGTPYYVRRCVRREAA